MNAQTIAARIRSALDAGVLSTMPDPAAAVSIQNMGDLLTIWKSAGALADANSYLRHPRFVPQRRCSSRPLPAPRRVVTSVKPVSARLLASLTAVWNYFEAKGEPALELLQEPITNEGVEKFADLLAAEVSHYDPLGVWLEELEYSAGDITDSRGLPLILPHTTYEDEAAGIIEAFLSGPTSVHSWIEHSYELMQHEPHYDFSLPAKDHALIKEVGFSKIVEVYADYAGKKSVDLRRLENWFEVFFGEVAKTYPKQFYRDWPIISGNGGQDAELWVASADDIHFALAYASAYEEMIDSMPHPWQLDQNDDGETETFIHELCEVWRKAHGKRSVRWSSPKRATLAYLHKKGQL